jgi:mycothiol system anti-sigma-R factor
VTEFLSGAGRADSSACGESRIKAECRAVIAEVWTLLDGECTPEIRRKLRRHLEECPRCLWRYGLEERIKELIASKCRGEKAPEGFLERLRLEISQTTIIRW